MTQTGSKTHGETHGMFRQNFLNGAKDLQTPKERAELFFEQLNQSYKSRRVASEHMNPDQILESVEADITSIYEHRDEFATVIANGVQS